MTAELTTGRRARRKAQTRQRLLDAALASFVSRGYAGTTMDQIAEDADVARSTLFNYFARKEDLLFAGMLVDIRDGIRTTIADCRAGDTDTVTTVRELVSTLTAWYEAQPVARATMLRCALEAGGPRLPEWYGTAPLFAEVLRDGVRRGDLPVVLDLDVAARLLLDAYLGVLVRWALDPDGVALKDELELVVSLYLDGMGCVRKSRDCESR